MRRRAHPGLRWRAAVLLAGMACVAAVAGAAGVGIVPQSGPLVQFVEANESGDHVDLSVQFACSVRYISTTPLDHGTSVIITLRLGPDCGTRLNSTAPELPFIGGGVPLVTGARLESSVPGQVTLELSWSRDLGFVMAPTASGLGLRLRLLGTSKRRASVNLPSTEVPEGYTVNLESAFTAFERSAVEAAAGRLKTQAYVSETDIEEQHWYRLRAGPFTTRAEAERVLQAALPDYPRAWLAVNDDDADLAAVERAGVRSTAADAVTDPALPDAERARLLADARVAVANHQYPEAIDLLTRLLRQGEYPARADAQELMGIVRERAGQLAQAKAEDEEYLRRYPDTPGARRVRERLQALATASLSAKSVGDGATAADKRWTMAGSAAVGYEYGRDQNNSAGTSTSSTSLNSALVYGDLLVRDRGQRYDFTARVNAGYTQNLLSVNGGSQDRTTAAYAELTDRVLGLTGRIGRQSLASQGVIGLFDGIYAGYQWNSKLTLSAAAGFPAYTSYSQFSSHQVFETVTAEYGPYRQAWVFDAYLFNETDAGSTERRAVGLQARYSEPGRSAVVLVDYDVQFQQLNSATLIGNLKVTDQWIMGFDADHRRSPLLQLSNALIGQATQDLSALQNLFTPSQIRQLALDRTATSNTFVVSASRSIGERWQFMGDLSALQLSGTPASGGVAATTSPGVDKNISLQLSGASLLQAGDLEIFGVRYDDSPQSRSATVSWDARFVLPGTWRVGPRLSVEQLKDTSGGTTQYLYLPELRGDWTGRRSIFELIAGYQIQQQQTQFQLATLTGQLSTATTSQRHLYVSATYRLRF